MLVRRGSCCWGMITLVGKNMLVEKRSCWWEGIMWLLQDGKLLQKYDFRTNKYTFSQNGLQSVRSQHKSQQTICRLAAHLFLLKIPREKGPM